jgi:nitroreductase
VTDSSSSMQDLPAGAGEIYRILCGRRTVHDFQPEPVPEALILRAIETARWAPNHHRTEPWHFYLLGEKARARIARLNAELVRESRGERAAEIKLKRWLAMPGWLVLTCIHSDDPVREREDYAACCCAAQNMMLYLWAAGVGAKWTTGQVVGLDAFYAAVGIARDREYVVGMFWYGWPATVAEQHRKPLEGLVERID